MSSTTSRRARRAPTITTEIVTITPALAEDWLGKNLNNRDLRNRDVAALAEAITRGEWTMNGDAIRFDEDDHLLDGQHRLWAVVVAERPISSLVVRGLPRETQETMDHGRRRNLRDVFKLRGEADPSALAAIVNYHWRWTQGNIRVASDKPTVAQAVAHLEANPGLREARAATDRLRRRIRLSVAMIGAVWFELRTIDPESTDVFFETLASGAGLAKQDPRLVLRGWLERQSISGAGAKASALVTHAMIIKAWNHWREGEQINVLNWKTTGTHAEAFPVPR